MSYRPHVVVLNRWRERYVDYADCLDHTRSRVTYISTAVGLGSVPAAATDVVVVPATDDLDRARRALAELVRGHGRPDRIVALKEDDLLVGARLRADHDIPGDRPDDLIVFRDKLLMCRAVEAAGLPVPGFTAADDPAAVLDLAGKVGWPLVVKPRVGSASAGVRLLTGAHDVAALPPDRPPMLAQAYDPRPIHHVDGVFTGTGLAAFRVSRYVNTCLGFRDGAVLGSVELDDPRVVGAVGTATARFLGALTDRPTPFHLELFVYAGPDRVSCAFLEVGARVGGAEIPFLWRELHGFDLMRVAVGLQTGRPWPAPPPGGGTGSGVDGGAGSGVDGGVGSEVGGWLLVPAPAARPCVITEATPMVGRIPGPYAEALLAPGAVLPAADAYYEHVGGRFRFRGRTSAEVEAAVRATAAAFRVRAEPVDERPRESVPMKGLR